MVPRCWNSVVDDQLEFIQSDIYTLCEGDIGVYVDDIVLAAKNEKQLNDVKLALADCFDIKYLGKLHYFPNKIVQNEEASEVWIGQSAYTHSLLQKFDMENAKPVKTPVDTCTKLVPTGYNFPRLQNFKVS